MLGNESASLGLSFLSFSVSTIIITLLMILPSGVVPYDALPVVQVMWHTAQHVLLLMPFPLHEAPRDEAT